MSKPKADKATLNALIPVCTDVHRAIATLRRPRRKRPVAKLACTTLPASYWDDLKPKAQPGDVIEVAVGNTMVSRFLVLGQGARLLPTLLELGNFPVIGTVTEHQVPSEWRQKVFG